jgi:hypothetical protein
MPQIEVIAKKLEILGPHLDERQRRLWAAAEALSLGRGGISTVSAATGISRTTIRTGIAQIESGEAAELDGRVRRPGGGRKRLEVHAPGLLAALDALIDPVTRGDPESPLRWTSKSLRQLADALTRQGFPISPQKVAEMLYGSGYSLQGTQKTLEGATHPDRDAQFHYIADKVSEMQLAGEPVISVDTKKKELVGNFSNRGLEWQPHGEPVPVMVHDFVDPDLGKAIPYGVYDLSANDGWVSVGVDHDTAAFAVETIRRWWFTMGRERYRGATKLLITADSGGSNSARGRAWKLNLQLLADELGLTIYVSHYPPGTSKWNKIEHRMFSRITQNWRGRPLVSHEVIVNLIASTTSATGLKIRAALDEAEYPLGLKVSKEQMNALRLSRSEFHGDWNYTLSPRGIV